MAFESVKEQLKDNWTELSGKIQENSTFNNLREKFESQSPSIQRAIIGALAALFVLLLLSFPMGYLSDSSDHMTEFNDNRSLLLGLLHAARTAKEPSPLPPPIEPGTLRSQIDAVLKEHRLIPDQIGEIQPLPANPAKNLAPPVVIQTGIVVQLKKLNLEQMTSLSYQLQSLGQGMKLMGIDIVQSAGQTHYYDMIARVVQFALPVIGAGEPDVESKGAKKGPKKRPAKATEEETPE